MKISKDMLIGQVVQEHPDAAKIMMEYGLHCIGCHVSLYESIEEGCKGHGMEDKQIDEMIGAINEAIKD